MNDQPNPLEAELDQELGIREVHAILAGLGGDLLATYGETRTRAAHPDAHALAALGGYLLERYGHHPDVKGAGA